MLKHVRKSVYHYPYLRDEGATKLWNQLPRRPMIMKELQNQVERFIQQHELQTTAEYFALDIVSEMGEVTKEILRASNYGRKNPESRSEVASELGDLFYSIIALANHLEVDLESQLHKTLNKYRRRVAQGGTPDSANE